MLAEARGSLVRDLALKEACESQLVVFHIGLSGSASDSRSQIQNHAAALFALELRSPLTELPVASALGRGRCDKAGRLKVNDESVDQSVTTTTLLAGSTRAALLSQDRVWRVSPDEIKESRP